MKPDPPSQSDYRNERQHAWGPRSRPRVSTSMVFDIGSHSKMPPLRNVGENGPLAQMPIGEQNQIMPFLHEARQAGEKHPYVHRIDRDCNLLAI